MLRKSRDEKGYSNDSASFHAGFRLVISSIAHWACSAMRGDLWVQSSLSLGRSFLLPVFPSAMQTFLMNGSNFILLIGDFAKTRRKSSRVMSRKSEREWEKISSRA